ncbi:putative pyruvate decarboxylase [Helianthus debilis subsp. tardiflorus]
MFKKLVLLIVSQRWCLCCYFHCWWTWCSQCYCGILHHTIELPDLSQELRCFQTVTCYQVLEKKDAASLSASFFQEKWNRMQAGYGILAKRVIETMP